MIGGGYIAVEFASMLVRLGVRVAMYYRDRLPLRGFDEMLRTAAAADLQAAGVELHPGNAPRRIQRTAAGLLLVLGEDRVREFPWVLNATGRRPNTARLGLETVGLQPDAAGAVPVDAAMHTGVPGLHAIGDVTNRKNLTPVAIAEGRALADSLFGPAPREVDLSLVASAVFMLPPLASIGPTEAEAVAAGHRVKVFETDFRPMKQAFIGGSERTRMKLLVDADHRPRAGRAHERRRRARDRAEPGRGADGRRHQGAVRPHDRDAPHRGGGVRADARAQPRAGACGLGPPRHPRRAAAPSAARGRAPLRRRCGARGRAGADPPAKAARAPAAAWRGRAAPRPARPASRPGARR